MDARMFFLQPVPELRALVYCPAVQQQQDVCIGVEIVHADHAFCVRQENLGDPAPHGFLRAPLVVAAGDVDASSSGCSSTGWQTASSLALKDELQW